MITNTTKVRRSPRAAAHGLGEAEGGVILHLESGQYHALSSVGWVIWSLLDQPRDITELVTGVRGAFPDAGDQAHDDVLAFVRSLLERDLIEIVT